MSDVETVILPGRRLVRFDRIETWLTEAPDRAALLRNRRFRRAVFEALDAALLPEDDTPGLLSLDVFDTLLLRDGSSEVRRFGEIGARMAACAGRGINPVDAFMARHLATQASYRAGPRVEGCGEGSLREIHLTAARLLGLPDAVAADFVEAEITYEVERVAPNDLLLSYMRKHRARGGRTVLVSDMYMHADHIAELLARRGIRAGAYDGLYSSADTKVSKASGRIFSRVEEARDARQVLHLGDNLHSDVLMPRAAGWKALFLPVPDAILAERHADRLRCLEELWRRHRVDLEGECAA